MQEADKKAYKEQYIDTHAHLDFDFDLDTNTIVLNAKEKKVNYIINISSSVESLAKVSKLSITYNNIYNTLGIHPHDAKDYSKEVENNIYKLKNVKTVAIGEIGLDFFYLHSSKEQQKKVFIKQIEIAKALGLKIVLHVRDAHKEALDILEQEKTHNAVIHCYSSTKDNLKKYLDLGLYVSFTGIITFKKSNEIKEALKYAPLDRIMLETDSPFLAPSPYRGKTNYPEYIPIIAKEAAIIKNILFHSFSDAVFNNSINFFNIKKQ
jgi:TatD DNase family protein